KFAYGPSAEIVVAVIGVAFAASCIFLMIRIIGRRKRPGWRFWMTALFAALLAYPLSVGPVAWLSFHDQLPDWAAAPLDYLFSPAVPKPQTDSRRLGPVRAPLDAVART